MTKEMLNEFTAAARAHAAERETLSERVANLQAEIEAAKRRLLPGIRNAASRARDTRDALAALVEAHPEAFARPRTLTIAGVKFGLQKQRGTISWEDASAVVKAIRKHYPERFDDLVKVTEKPNKAALNGLTVAEARKLGCTLTEDSDQPLIKSAHDDVDKLVSALLDENSTEEGV